MNKTLMVVDDSSIIRRKIMRALEQTSVEIAGDAANGLEAVRRFRRQPTDAVTMDITMPHMDGIECVEALIAIRPEVRILVISALNDKATAIEAIMKGAHGFLCKPFNDQELKQSLYELLDMELSE